METVAFTRSLKLPIKKFCASDKAVYGWSVGTMCPAPYTTVTVRLPDCLTVPTVLLPIFQMRFRLTCQSASPSHFNVLMKSKVVIGFTIRSN